MMKVKRLFVFCMALTLLFVLAACGNATQNGTAESKNLANEETETAVTASENDKETKPGEETSSEDLVAENTDNSSDRDGDTGTDILVVYFSRTGEQYGVGVIYEGNTAIVAQMIAEQTGADMFEILPVDDHYPMTYSELTDVAKQEQNENARPAYAGEVPDLSQYSTVFIGAPVWWGDWPMICYTFFENEDLSGKTLYPFSTHAGSGLSGFDRKLSSAEPDSMVGDGLAISGTDCQSNRDGVRSKVNDWLSGLGY